jgi:phosphatidylinositol alpha-mannosyltransferase
MKIALVSPYDYAHPGGVTSHISYLHRYFTQMGHSVTIIAPHSKSKTSHLDEDFIAVGRPFPIPTSGSIARITLSPRSPVQVKRILKREQFDIIHLHEPLTPMSPLTVLRLSNTATVGTFHAYHGKPRGYGLWKPLIRRWFLHRLDGKIAVSRPAMEFISKHFPGYYTIIPNGVDVEHFSPDASPFEHFRDGKLNILFTGRLEKRKGFIYLLKAYEHIKREDPDVRLIVVGPGTRLRRKYEGLIKKKRLKDVVFAGYVPYTDLPRYYKSADVFCAPATGLESFGIVLLEAMAVGTPVVASNIAGYASVMTHGSEGFLVPPRDEDALAETLSLLLKDESLRQQMGARGRLKAEEHSWPLIAQLVMDYYLRILDEPRWRERSSAGQR